MTTQTMVGKARIFPSTDANTDISKTVRRVGARIQVQWDGITWTDESDYFLTAGGNYEMSDKWGAGIAGQADFELDNTTGRFLPENTSSPIYSYLKPRVNIRYDVRIGSYYYRIFTGFIKAIEPDRKQGIVNFHCFDNTVKVLNKEAPKEAAYTNKRADELLAILAEAANITDYDLEISEHVISAAWFGDKYIWPIMGELAVSERGRVFFDYDGRFKFWNKSHIEKQQTPIFTLTRDDWMKNLNFSVEEQAIKNKVQIKARPRVSAGIQDVWTNGDIQILNQYSDTLVWIPANDQQNAWIETEDPCTSWIQPIPRTDYTASSAMDGVTDSEGNPAKDLTDSVQVTVFDPYASECFIQVQNFSDQDAYLTMFKIRANPLQIWDWIRVIKIDQQSIDTYGEQKIELENDFIEKEEWAEFLARTEVDRWKDAKNLFRADIIGVPHIKVGDVVSVEVTEGDFENYMIYGMDWEVTNSGFLQTLQFVLPFTIPVYQTITARAQIHAPVYQSITAKALLGAKTITASANIKESKTKFIQAKGVITVG